MAMLNHRMSTVLGIDSDVVTRRVAPALAALKELGCPPVPDTKIPIALPASTPAWLKTFLELVVGIDPQAGIESICVGIGTCARFVRHQGGVAYQQPLHVDVVLDVTAGGNLASVGTTLPIRCDVLLNLMLEATFANGTLTLTGQYQSSADETNDPSVFVTAHGPAGLAQAMETAIKSFIIGAGGSTPPQSIAVPLGVIGTALGTDPVVAMRPQDGRAVGSTLMIGIGRADDDVVDANAFSNSTTPFVATEDWAIEIEDDVIVDAIEAMLADPLTGLPSQLIPVDPVTLPIGAGEVTAGLLVNPMAGTAFWSGAEPPDLGGMEQELGFVTEQHAAWIVLDASFVHGNGFGGSISHEVQLLAHGDFRIVDEELRFESRPFRYRIDGFEISSEDAAVLADSGGLAATEVQTLQAGAGTLEPTTTGFTADRLSIGGRDTAEPFRGPPKIDLPTKIEATNEPHGCRIRLAFDNDIEAAVTVRNTGYAPLWVCEMTMPDGAPFEVSPAAGDGTFPLLVPPRSAQVVLVRYEGDEDTTVETTMTVRSNDCTRPVVEIPVTGTFHPDDAYFPSSEICFREDLIPEAWPYEWFERITAITTRITEEMQNDDPLILRLRVRGIPANESIWTSSESGSSTQPTLHVGTQRLVQARLTTDAPHVLATTATRWAASPDVHLDISGEEELARVRGPAPRALHTSGSIALAQHDDHVDVVVVSRDRRRGHSLERVGQFEARPDAACGIGDGGAWLQQDDDLHWFDLGDLRSPEGKRALDLRGRTIRAAPGGFVLASRDRVERYSVTGAGVRFVAAWSFDESVNESVDDVFTRDGRVFALIDDSIWRLGTTGGAARGVRLKSLPEAAVRTLRPRAATQAQVGSTILAAVPTNAKAGLVLVRPQRGAWTMDHREAAAILGVRGAGHPGERKLLHRGTRR